MHLVALLSHLCRKKVTKFCCTCKFQYFFQPFKREDISILVMYICTVHMYMYIYTWASYMYLVGEVYPYMCIPVD